MLISEVVPARLWWSDLPSSAGLLTGLGVNAVYDVADADSYDPDAVQSLGRYVKLPLEDGDEVPVADVIKLRDQILAELQNDQAVLVHCTFGKNRSGLLVAMVLRSLDDLTGAEALQRVRSLRHNAVNNETFAAWLNQLPAPSHPVELDDLGPLASVDR